MIVRGQAAVSIFHRSGGPQDRLWCVTAVSRLRQSRDTAASNPALATAVLTADGAVSAESVGRLVSHGKLGWTAPCALSVGCCQLLARAVVPARPALRLIERALERGALSVRGYDRVLRVTWERADLPRRTWGSPTEVVVRATCRVGFGFPHPAALVRIRLAAG